MNRDDQCRKAEAFLNMHQGLLLLPTAWDALSARIFEDAGCRAIATTSAGVAWSLGYADGERVPWSDFLAAVERIVRTVRVPVTADIEGGFGDATAVAQHVRDVVRVGAVGINLEDSDARGGALLTVGAACDVVSAARAAAEREGLQLVINARVDAYLRPGAPRNPFEETLIRARAYLDAGADCVYPIGLGDLQTIRRLTAELGAPVNVMGRPGAPSLPELRAVGVARVSLATTPALHVAGVLEAAIGTLEERGTFEHFASSYGYPDIQGLFQPRE